MQLSLPKPAPEVTIIDAPMGSVVYGTNHKDSDADFMSVVLADETNYLSLQGWGEQGTKQVRKFDENGDVEWEKTSYEMLKFLRLCQNFNPNVIVLLYLRPEDYITCNEYGKLIVENRKLFTSRVAVESFCGYAHNQLNRMGQDGASTGQLGHKRKMLRQEFGFDTKYMYHAVRLTRMMKEFVLSNGETLNVWRGDIDAEELLSIRFGAWTYDQGKAYIEKSLSEIREAAENTDIPAKPCKSEIGELSRYILRKHLTL